MKELFTRRLTSEERNLIGCLIMLVGLMFIVLGLRSPVGALDCGLTYIGLFMLLPVVGMSGTSDDETED